MAWRSGARRRVRTRVGGAVGAVAVVLIAATVGLLAGGTSATPVLPGNSGLGPGQGLPSRIYTPTRWLDTIGGQPIPPMAYVYVSTGQSRLLAEGSSNQVSITGLSWSPDATQVAWQEAAHRDSKDPGTVFVTTLAGGVDELRGFRGSVAWSPDGKRFLATQADGGAVITDLSGAVLVSLDVPTNTAFSSLLSCGWVGCPPKCPSQR